MRRSGRAAGWCEFHEKLLYVDRKTARKVSKQHHEDHKSEYECTMVPGMYHVGGVPDEVMKGQMTRTEYYRGVL